MLQKRCLLNLSVPAVRTWYNNYPLEVFGDEAKGLLDGIINDGMGYSPSLLMPANVIRRARNDAYFAGKMLLGDEARALYGGLNGGEVWGNAALGVTARYANYTYEGALVSWRTVMDTTSTPAFSKGRWGCGT